MALSPAVKSLPLNELLCLRLEVTFQDTVTEIT